MSLRIVPAPSHPTATRGETSAPSAPGVHDTLRSNLSLTSPQPSNNTSTQQTPSSTHPLESRLLHWRAQQQTLQMTLLRNQFGIAEPVKRQMETGIVAQGEWRPACLGGSAGVHADVLAGRDAQCDWEDVFTGQDGLGRGEGGMRGEMERGM